MTDETEVYITGLEDALRKKQNETSSANAGLISNAVFGGGQDNNLIVFQLELDNILDKIEHLLRGDLIVLSKSGDLVYEAPKDKDLVILNEYGTKLVMNVISFYLNRNTILSHYGEERIFEILGDLGEEFSDLIFCNYEKMGMDTPQKKSRYPMLVLSVLHTIESAYNRSLKGGERDSLRSARVVTQNEPLGNASVLPQMSRPKKQFSVFRPSTWSG